VSRAFTDEEKRLFIERFRKIAKCRKHCDIRCLQHPTGQLYIYCDAHGVSTVVEPGEPAAN
jgi:hypothetical protein